MDLLGGEAVIRCLRRLRCLRADVRLRQRHAGDAYRARRRPRHDQRCACVTHYINAVTGTSSHTVTNASPAGASIACASDKERRQAVG
jgi:hypothetical protein